MRLTRLDSNELVVRFPRFVGPVFVAVGAVGVFFVLKIPFDMSVPARIFACIVAGALAVGGLVTTFYTNELRVDFVRKRYEMKKGFLLAPKEYSGGIEEFRRVILQRRPGGDGREAYGCSLAIEHEGKEDVFKLPENMPELEAHAMAARLSRPLGVPLRDETGEKSVELAPGELDLTFRERVAREGEALDLAELADPPGRLAGSITVAGPVLSMVLPRERLRGTGFYLIAFALLWNGLVAFAVVGAARKAFEDPKALLGILFLSIFVAMGLGLFLLTGFMVAGREKLTLSPGGIAIEMRFLSRSWMRREAKGAEVREVGLRPEKPDERQKVRVRTAGEVIEFGSSLEREELEWLARLVRAVLSAQAS